MRDQNRVAIPFFSINSYFGESTFISYTSNYLISHFNYWSAGTGLTGIFVGGSYILLEILTGIGDNIFLFYLSIYLLNLSTGLILIKYGDKLSRLFRKRKNDQFIELRDDNLELEMGSIKIPSTEKNIDYPKGYSNLDDTNNWTVIDLEQPENISNASCLDTNLPPTGIDTSTLNDFIVIDREGKAGLVSLNNESPFVKQNSCPNRLITRQQQQQQQQKISSSLLDNEDSNTNSIKKYFKIFLVSSSLWLEALIRYFFAFAIIPYIVQNKLHFELVTFAGYTGTFLGKSLGTLYTVKNIYSYNLIHFYNLVALVIMLTTRYRLDISLIMAIIFISNILNSSCYPQVFKHVLNSPHFTNKKFYTTIVCQFVTFSNIISAISSTIVSHYLTETNHQLNISATATATYTLTAMVMTTSTAT